MNGRRPPPSSIPWATGQQEQAAAYTTTVAPPPVSWSASVERGAQGWSREQRSGGGDSKTPLEKCAYRVRISHGAEIKPVVCATVSSVEVNNFRA